MAAAERVGVTEVILPRRNGPDLEEVPAEVRDRLRIRLAENMDEVLAEVLAAPEEALVDLRRQASQGRT